MFYCEIRSDLFLEKDTMDTIRESKRRGALLVLKRDGWLEVEFLETHLGQDILAEAFGYIGSVPSTHQKFSPTELKKLRLLGRIYAAISEVYDRRVVRNWLWMNNPALGEETPLRVMASQKIGFHPKMTWAQTEQVILDAAQVFLEYTD